MKTTTELKQNRNNPEGVLKQKNGLQNNLGLFIEECRLQKRFFTGQITIGDYQSKKKILKMN